MLPEDKNDWLHTVKFILKLIDKEHIYTNADQISSNLGGTVGHQQTIANIDLPLATILINHLSWVVIAIFETAFHCEKKIENDLNNLVGEQCFYLRRLHTAKPSPILRSKVSLVYTSSYCIVLLQYRQAVPVSRI